MIRSIIDERIANGQLLAGGVETPSIQMQEDPGFLRLIILCVVVELNEILLQEWRERRYASIK